MNAFAKLKFGPSAFEAPEPPMHLSPRNNRGTKIQDNRTDVSGEIEAVKLAYKMHRAGLQFIDPKKVRSRGAKNFRDDINLFDPEVVFEGQDDLLPSDLVEVVPEPVVSLAAEPTRRMPVRQSVFNTRTALAAAAGALLGLMASGGAGAAYAYNQMGNVEKAPRAKMVKAAAPQFDESARILAEMDDEPEVEYVKTMDCSVPFETLGKKMDKWGGWQTVRKTVAKQSMKPTVCEAHEVVKRSFGQKVADKFEYEAKHVPETSKTVKKRGAWNTAKKMASKAKKWFGWA